MGYYVNPDSMTKEQWLEGHGRALPVAPMSAFEHEGFLPVCLVNNGNWTAAGIAVDDHELAIFSDVTDARRRMWYWVSIERLKEVSPQFAEYWDREHQ